MGFTVHEYLDLVRLLEEHPEWRSELRRLLLSDELLALPASVRELVEALRRTEEKLETLVEALRRAEERLSRAEERLDHLEITTKTLESHVGKLRGQSLEITYRDKAGAYFSKMLLRTRVVALESLEERLEVSLSEEEYLEASLLDLIVKGKPRQRPDIAEVLLAVEISVVIYPKEVERVQRRASLLRKAGYFAVPVVAGEQITDEAEDAARLHKVAMLQDGGKVSLWEEALYTWIDPVEKDRS
jgi:DNA repair exonuclease SbcCD ATPase subunit